MSYIQQATKDLAETLSAKNADYRISGEFSNFEFAAKVVGDWVDAADIIKAQIGIKLGRLEGLPQDPNNESRLDTLKDLAGYAIILYAHGLASADAAEGGAEQRPTA